MTHASKDPIAVATMALQAGRKALPAYSHPKSPHKYTQPQLFALLVLKQFFRLDYRGTVEWVRQWSDLRKALGLKQVPSYRTLHEADRRLLKKGGFSGSSTPASNRLVTMGCSAMTTPSQPSIPRG